MSVPPAISALLDLLKALSSGETRLAGGPARVAAPLGLLRPEARPDALSAALAEAEWLAPDLDAIPDAEGWEQVAACATECELWLDLRLPGVSDLAALPAAGTRRVARLHFTVDDPAALIDDAAIAAVARAAGTIPGYTVLEVPCGAADLDDLPVLLERLGARCPRVAVKLAARTLEDRLALQKRFGDLAVTAENLGLALRARGVGAAHGAHPLDPLAPWNVLNEGYRGVFRGRLHLCPLPFISLHFTAQGRVLPCPVADGPLIAAAEDPDPWNGPPMQELRATFLSHNVPAPCARCLLRPRILSALQEE